MTAHPTPSRIEYIVLSHLPQSKKLIEDFGYEAPEKATDVIQGIKFLIRKHKRKAVTALLKIHPDRKALIAIQREEEDHFCSACSESSYDPIEDQCGSCGHSNYNGNKSLFLDKIRKMELPELEKYYQNLLEKSKDFPKDASIQEEVELVWNELRQLKPGQDPQEQEEEIPQTMKIIAFEQTMFFTVMGLTLLVGGLIGNGFNKGG